jgi:hypothetical protein
MGRQIKVVFKEIRWEVMESNSVAQDKDKWWAFVKVIMDLLVYKMQGI